jgi:hypothetical protein
VKDTVLQFVRHDSTYLVVPKGTSGRLLSQGDNSPFCPIGTNVGWGKLFEKIALIGSRCRSLNACRTGSAAL